MAAGGSLVGEWSRAAKSALVAAGWTKRGGADIFTCALDDHTLAWVGLNRATKYMPIAIWPIVGVRHEATMRLVDELMASSPAMAPTLCHPLQYLGGRTEKALQVGEQLDIEDAAKELVDLLKRFALPFALSLQDPERQLEALSARVWLPVPEYAIARRPAMLAVLGRSGDVALPHDGPGQGDGRYDWDLRCRDGRRIALEVTMHSDSDMLAFWRKGDHYREVPGLGGTYLVNVDPAANRNDLWKRLPKLLPEFPDGFIDVVHPMESPRPSPGSGRDARITGRPAGELRSRAGTVGDHLHDIERWSPCGGRGR